MSGLEAPIVLLIWVLAGAAILYIVYWATGLIEMPPVIRNIIIAIAVLVFVLWLLRLTGVL